MVEDLISAYAYAHACEEETLKSVLSTGWTAEKESRKASYPQQAKAKPQYHPPKCASIESDCKEQNRTLAAFLPKPPNTGFGDVRCRIGAERLVIYLFYSFFSFFIFLVLFQFFCIFKIKIEQ